MKTFILLIVFGTHYLLAQPMSGNYTVGGTNNHFATLMEAKYALVARGVSGPVTFNIRPGIYIEDNGNKTVLSLDTLINGASETNRITFQPDAASGGNVDNVRLRFNRINSTVGDRDLIHIRLDNITIRSLTIEDTDSSHKFDNSLIRLENLPSNLNPTVDGFILEGCKLIGTPFIQNGSTFLGTDQGIKSSQTINDIIIRGNTFIRLLRAVSLVNGSNVAQAMITVEDNTILEGYRSTSGSGNFLGAGIEISCTTAVVRRNIIDFNNSVNGGGTGIKVFGAVNAVMEKNIVKGIFATGISVLESFNVGPESILIKNNMITGAVFQPHPSIPAISLSCESGKTKIAFNTIVVPPFSANATALRVNKIDCEVYNNIIEMYATLGFTIVYDQGNQGSLNLISDHNIIYKSPQAGNGPVVVRNGVQYQTLEAYQSATGLDTNSFSKEINFIDINSDLHLTECQAQDPDIKGIPLAEVIDDFDGDTRNPLVPTIGADEAVLNVNPFFDNVFSENLPGTPFSIAAGKFDNLIGDGIAVPDFANKQVLLYHNNASTNSFSHTGTLSTGFNPIAVLFNDFDDDGNLDLIAGGSNPNGIKIFWGDGAGNFPEVTVIDSTEVTGAVLNLVPEPFPVDENFKTIFIPGGQEFYFLFNFGGRSVCFDYLRDSSDGFLSFDTLPNFMHSIAINNFGGDSRLEIAGVSHTTGHFSILNNMRRIDDPFPFCIDSAFVIDYSEQHFQTGWYSYANSIIQEDFDNDGDIDFITTGSSSSDLVFIKNEGSFNFTNEIIETDDPARALAVLDYDNDDDPDFVALNFSDENGVTLFVNDGFGNFSAKLNCFQNLIEGIPSGVIAKDFDLDGLTDIAVSSLSGKFFVLYNSGISTSVLPEQGKYIPEEYVLDQNYPNPFNPVTKIRYFLSESSETKLTVYDILGRTVKVLVNEQKEPGNYEATFNGADLASGIYIYTLQVNNFISSRKMLLVK